MTDIHDLRHRVATALVALSIVHVAALTGLAVVLTASPAAVFCLAALLAAVPLTLRILRRPPRTIALALTGGLVGQTMLLVYVFAGQPWQVEMHFYFFAVLAMLAAFCDVPILVVGAALIAIHHLLTNWLLPSALYPGGADLFRVLVHAAIVVIEAGMLIWFARLTEISLHKASRAEQKARDAARLLTAAAEQRELQLATSIDRSTLLESQLSRFREAVATSLARLAQGSRDLDETADAFSQAVIKTTHDTGEVVSSADSAASQVEEVASVSRNFLETISTICDKTLSSAHVGEVAIAEAAAATSTIDELTFMSTQISGVTDLIRKIASQTNLLALNATIEAARAGEGGRGFAVVAAEVKVLSSETEKATTSIASMVRDIQEIAERAAAAIGRIAGAIGALTDANSTIAQAVSERTEAAAAISSHLETAATDVTRVASTIERIRAVALESAQHATMLKLAAGDIARQTGSIEREVKAFAMDVVPSRDLQPDYARGL